MKKWTFGVDLGGTEIKFGLSIKGSQVQDAKPEIEAWLEKIR